MATNYCNADFDARDFDSQDFETTYGGYDFGFRTYLFSLLPVFFKKEDSYKDQNDKGLLERYLSVLGTELDAEVVPAIHCYLNAIDAQLCKEKFLNHISDSVGNPPDIFQDDAIYRNLLSYIVTFYKIKGTIKSYKLFFAILGFDVEIEELPHQDDDSYYDSEAGYDTGEERSRYDMNACLICYYYNIKIKPLDPAQPLVISTSTLNKLREVIYFNEPINCVLGTFTSTLDVNTNLPTSSTPEQIIKWVDTIRAVGNFGSITKAIESSWISEDKKQIIFSTTFDETDFNGQINYLELRKESTGYIMGTKNNVQVVKDSESRVKINWTINI